MSDGSLRLNVIAKPGAKEPEEFTLEEAKFTLVSVFLVQESKTPLQGAYVPEDDFAHIMRRLGLKDLLRLHPCVQVSPMEDIRAWIAKSNWLE